MLDIWLLDVLDRLLFCFCLHDEGLPCSVLCRLDFFPQAIFLFRLNLCFDAFLSEADFMTPLQVSAGGDISTSEIVQRRSV
jgi:hypothetical protein